MSVRTTLRALPTLFRIGVAETVAYRAEFFVWMLTTTMPLVMLALWTSVAAERPFHGFDTDDFIAYYLLALIVRNLTSSWVVWQMNEEVRRGVLSMRLLRPIHPFVAYSVTHLAAVPLRALVATPVAIILLVTSARDVITSDPTRLGLFVPSLALAWVLTFALMLAIGSLVFFMDKSLSIMDVYFGVFAVLSGYLLPLPMLPSWIGDVARWLPFRYMLSAPIELVTRAGMSSSDALALVGQQLAWAVGLVALALFVWSRGIRRFEAVGA
jgi:ABC-2 type transport system permease protein